jgi:hypothetical protein
MLKVYRDLVVDGRGKNPPTCRGYSGREIHKLPVS